MVENFSVAKSGVIYAGFSFIGSGPGVLVKFCLMLPRLIISKEPIDKSHPGPDLIKKILA